MKKVKILVSYNEPQKIIKSKIFCPIQVGRSLSAEVFENMIGDNTGRNISQLFPDYKELTAIYWAYQNYEKIGSPDYIGFMESTKHFVLNENFFGNTQSISKKYGLSIVDIDNLEKTYLQDIGLVDENIYKELDKTDIITIRKSDLKCLGADNLMECVQKGILSITTDDYQDCLEIIKEIFPEYSRSVEELSKSSSSYLYNQFIMKKSLFRIYCNFLFTILEKYSKQKNIQTINYKEGCYSDLGKIIFTVFMLNIGKNKKYKIKEFFAVSIKKAFFYDDIIPLYKNKNAISCSCSNLYVPYLAVYLESICKNSSKTNTYDIVVLETDISDFNKLKLLNMLQKYQNISLRFCNVTGLFANASLGISQPYFAKQCYYRLSVGKIFHEYEKVLFTDIDLIFNLDVSKMFDIKMNKYPLAACEEILWTKQNRIGRTELGYDVSDYITNVLNCTDKYFNTGVLLIDIQKFNKITSFEELSHYINENLYINQEQCLLNSVFNKKIKKLSSKYNFEIYKGIYENKASSYRQYMTGINSANIYHFLTSRKAWFYPELPKAELWWQYARQTPFYEEILARLIDFRISQQKLQSHDLQLRKEISSIHFPNFNNRFARNERQTKLLFVMDRLGRFKAKKAYYGIKKAFTFGEKHKKYQKKYDTVKALIKDAQSFKKQLLTV